jgi:hypothetical protein
MTIPAESSAAKHPARKRRWRSPIRIAPSPLLWFLTLAMQSLLICTRKYHERTMPGVTGVYAAAGFTLSAILAVAVMLVGAPQWRALDHSLYNLFAV